MRSEYLFLLIGTVAGLVAGVIAMAPSMEMCFR